VEVSDIVVINKADGDLLHAAQRIMAEYVSAVKFGRSKTPHWRTKASDVTMTSRFVMLPIGSTVQWNGCLIEAGPNVMSLLLINHQVLLASALRDEGIDKVWSGVEDFVRVMHDKGEFWERRKLQRKLWMWSHIDWQLANRWVWYRWS
jgi:LAO/AO transport system kinase